jgi:Protein of unknown function (DUF2800)
MTEHATYSLSSTARWLECPASARIAASMPVKERSGAAADAGTRVHKSIELAVKSGKKFDELDLDDDSYEPVALVLSFLRQLGDGRVFTEHRVGFRDIPDAWGTLDLFHDPVVTNPVFTVIDYKNGAWDVAAKDNKQLLSYAAAHVDALKDPVWREWFRLVIIQPNSFMVGETSPIKQWIAHISEIRAHKEKIRAAVARGNAGEKPIPGAHCRYCPAFGSCEATQGLLPFISEAIKLPTHAIPDEAIVKVLRILRGLTDYKNGLDKELLSRLADGRKIEGAELSATVPHRQWADESQAVHKLYAAYGVLGVEAVSPAKAEKLGPVGKEVVKDLSRKPTGAPKASY